MYFNIWLCHYTSFLFRSFLFTVRKLFFILYLLNGVFDILYGADGNKDTFIVIEQKRLILLSTLLCRGMEYLTIEEVTENWGITGRRT